MNNLYSLHQTVDFRLCPSRLGRSALPLATSGTQESSNLFGFALAVPSIHHIFMQNIPEIWYFPQLCVISQRQKYKYGNWVAKPYWNQGICTEALRLMLEHIRQMTDIKSLISGHFIDNPASGRVMEKCGFVLTGETCIDANQYQGEGRPIRVLRLELR